MIGEIIARAEQFLRQWTIFKAIFFVFVEILNVFLPLRLNGSTIVNDLTSVVEKLRLRLLSYIKSNIQYLKNQHILMRLRLQQENLYGSFWLRLQNTGLNFN
jgi:hypothetical protein